MRLFLEGAVVIALGVAVGCSTNDPEPSQNTRAPAQHDPAHTLTPEQHDKLLERARNLSEHDNRVRRAIGAENMKLRTPRMDDPRMSRKRSALRDDLARELVAARKQLEAARTVAENKAAQKRLDAVRKRINDDLPGDLKAMPLR